MWHCIARMFVTKQLMDLIDFHTSMEKKYYGSSTVWLPIFFSRAHILHVQQKKEIHPGLELEGE